MNTVVERCPNCGVEHGLSHVGPCEVCGHELRYWCQRHSREDLGWLSGPECPACQREEELGPPPSPAPPPPRPPATRRRPERDASAGGRPEPRAPRERRPPRHVRAEDVMPHLASGAGVALRLVRAVLVLVRSVFVWAFLGAAAAAAYSILMGGELLWFVAFGLMSGALLGFFLGLLPALFALLRRDHRR